MSIVSLLIYYCLSESFGMYAKDRNKPEILALCLCMGMYNPIVFWIAFCYGYFVMKPMPPMQMIASQCLMCVVTFFAQRLLK